MTPSILDRFNARNARELTGKENFGPASALPATVTTDGRRFSDVTNAFSSYSRRKNLESFHPTHFYDEDNSEHQEIYYLKNLLAQKEAILESTRQELQKALCYSHKSSQQNKQLTQTNGQMFAELCMLREKYKVLEHEYNQMTSVFRIKRAELEETVRDLSHQLENKHQILTKDSGPSENLFQSTPQHFSYIQNQNCYSEIPGDESNGGENNPGTNLLTKEGKMDCKRASSKRRLTSKRASHLTTRSRQGGQALSMPTLNQTDQSNASFSEQANLEEAIAVYGLSRANQPTNEEESKGKRTCLRRKLTSVSYNESPLHKKVRKEEPAVSTPTMDQNDMSSASLSRVETLGEFCDGYTPKEGECLPGANILINEEAANEKRVSLRRRPAHVSYKEPLLNTKLRQPGPIVSTKNLFRSYKHNTSNELENLEKARKRYITDEDGSSSRINVAVNEEKKIGIRVCSKQCPAIGTNGESNLKANTKHEEQTVQILDKVGEDHALHFDVPQSEAVHVDSSENPKGLKTEDIISKANRVEQQQLQETGPCHASASNTALEATKVRPSNGRPAPKAVESLTSSKEIPLNKVDEIKELHCSVSRKFGDLSQISESTQNCDLQTTEVITSKATRVQQHQVQETAPFHASTFNTALDATELRRPSTGRPVRKSVGTVASYKEIPIKIKMRRSQ